MDVGVYESLIQSRSATSQSKEFMATGLDDPADQAMSKSLNLTDDIRIHDGLALEATPETAEDAYDGWWITVYDTSALGRSHASQQELASITIPKPAITVRNLIPTISEPAIIRQ